jgi:N4-(beta-N-acetylglucosaminyl)-L-asparaginase
LHDIKNASAVAKAVMEHTGHVMLVGEGATRFGLDVGFPKENLLTDRSRKIWLLWKETNSSQDWWGPGMDGPGWKPPAPLASELKDQPLHIQKLYAKAAERHDHKRACVENSWTMRRLAHHRRRLLL